MKKLMIFGAAICVAMAFTGCKSSESAYKKAYEKALVIQQKKLLLDHQMFRWLLLLKHNQ